MTTDIANLADYEALQHLGRALWRNGSVRGAALLVGAGFTRNALRPGNDTRVPPLWSDLEKDLKDDLYRGSPDSAPRNPLRIAEEYRTSYGQSALDDFIRSRFPDKAWLPSPLHNELLDLPWSDVLTTNWDTVLERASEDVNTYRYELVRHEADLPYARSPRIIKLHGSIGDPGPLIFAEEDYRTYPTKHAAFVNLARQVFIENELCLLGFSGDDPNFLQWAGWVRDQLGGTARRIYLVGNLDLPAATRRFLEAHNIAPIDFAPILQHLPKSERYAEASRRFFAILRDAKPVPVHKWALAAFNEFPLGKGGLDISDQARKDDEFAQRIVDDSTVILKRDRECYPGWLVCPRHLRQRLQHGGAEQWIWRKSVLDRIRPARRAEVLFEIIWRRTIAFQPIEQSIEIAVGELLAGNTSEVNPDLVAELGLALMRDARISDNADAMATWDDFIDKKAPPESPTRIEAQYQRCLRARDVGDFRLLTDLLRKLTSNEPEWRLRRAALAAELGQYTNATKLIKDATEDLEKRFRLDRTSLWIKSRLGWADWLSQAIDMANFRPRTDSPRRQDFEAAEIDPFEEIDQIEKSAQGEEARLREEKQAITPLFQAGRYRDKGSTIRIRNSGLVYRFEADQLIEAVGLPIRLNNVVLCGSMAVQAAKVGVQPNLVWYMWLLRSVNGPSDATFLRYFGRVAMARLTRAVADSLIAACRNAVTYWLDRMRASPGPELRPDLSHASDALELYVTALAHLTVRMSADDAQAALKLALEICRDKLVGHPSLFMSIDNLISYAAESIPKSVLGGLALDVMEFPLSHERGLDGRFWPRAVMAIWRSRPERDPTDQRWRHRVNQLIQAVRDSKSRDEAVLRLTYLSEHNALLDDERSAFGEALWSKVDKTPNPLPANAGLLESTYLELPVPDDIDVRARVQARVIDGDLGAILSLPKPLDSSALADKQNQLIAFQNTKALGLMLSPRRAAEVFDQLTSWVANEGRSREPFAGGMIRGFNDSLRQRIGDLLAHVVVPLMGPADLTEVRGRALLDFIRRTQAWRAAPGIPYFVAQSLSLETDAVTVLRRGILGTDHNQVGSAALAVAVWAKLADEGQFGRQIPRALKERVLVSIESRQVHGLQTLLDVAVKLIRARFFDPSDLHRLMVALSDLRAELKYDGIDEESMLAVSVSLDRSECVALAGELISHVTDDGTLIGWIDEAKSDPLPEVRFRAAEVSERVAIAVNSLENGLVTKVALSL